MLEPCLLLILIHITWTYFNFFSSFCDVEVIPKQYLKLPLVLSLEQASACVTFASYLLKAIPHMLLLCSMRTRWAQNDCKDTFTQIRAQIFYRATMAYEIEETRTNMRLLQHHCCSIWKMSNLSSLLRICCCCSWKSSLIKLLQEFMSFVEADVIAVLWANLLRLLEIQSHILLL